MTAQRTAQIIGAGKHIWQVSYLSPENKFTTEDFLGAEAAAKRVEEVGSGSVVQFITRYNLPHALPEIVCSSLALWVYDEGEWWACAIFSSGQRLHKERPN